MLLYPFNFGWDSEAHYASFLAQDYSQLEVELLPKPCLAFFRFLSSKIKMIYVATEFKVR